MVIDCFTFNGEYDLLEIRLNILDDYVDQFIIVEAPSTFSGKPKPLYYEEEKARYAKWHDKIKYFVIDERYTPEEIQQAKDSPNTRGAEHWKREFLQKESIKKALTHLKDDDVVFIGDVDEIWEEFCVNLDDYGGVLKLPLRVYTYYLNNRSSEKFWGTIFGKYGYIKDKCLNHIRSNGCKFNPQKDGDVWYCGWHFTSMGGYEEMKRKLTDSYTKESYAHDAVMNALEDNMANNKDFLGRGFTYTLDTSEWPEYLQKNVDKYQHLMKN